MKVTGKTIFTYNNNENAKLTYESLEVDNENFLKSKLNKNKIVYEKSSDKLGSFIATLDDLIASEIVVEKIISNTKWLSITKKSN